MNRLTTRLVGILAVIALIGLIVGVPVFLVAVGQHFMPAGLPTFSDVSTALTSRDDGTLIAGLLYFVAWAAWAYLALALLIEVWAAIRRVRAPKITGFSLPQGIARPLVATAMLAFIPLASTAHAAPVPNDADVRSGTTASQSTDIGVAGDTTGGVEHTVVKGDTLGDLAQQYLGDRDRAMELFSANQGIEQADGSKLTNPDLIVTGTTLNIPDAAVAADVADGIEHTVVKGDTLGDLAQQYLGDRDRAMELFSANQGIEQADGSKLTNPDLIVTGTTLTIPSEAPAQTIEPTSSQPEETSQAAPAADEERGDTPNPSPSPSPSASVQQIPSSVTTGYHAPVYVEDVAEEEDAAGIRTYFGVGTILASGVISLIGAQRFFQRRDRRRGAALAMPEGKTAAVEQELRSVRNPMLIAEVDLALRSLAQHCRDHSATLPDIRVARLTEAGLELYLLEPEQLPEPWVGTASGLMWSFQSEAVDELDAESLREIPAPYPSLVCLGQDLEDAHILVDLEVIGELTISGGEREAESVIAAIAMELATSHWADDLTVTLVGGFAEMEETLQTGRIRYLPTVGRLFDELQIRADQDRAALQVEQAADAHHARVTSVAPSTWFPEIVILTQPITDHQQEQLDRLLTAMPRVAVASVAIDGRPNEWTLHLGDEGKPTILQPLGLTIRHQHIDAEAYHHILEIVDITHHGQEIQNEMTDAAVTSLIDDAEQFLYTQSPKRAVEEPQEHVPDSELEEPPAPETLEEATVSATEETPEETRLPARSETGELDELPVLGPREDQPCLQVLGTVDLVGAEGTIEQQRKGRLLEYLAYLVLSEGEATSESIDDAIWPNRKKQNNSTTRDPATSRLRKWLGTMPDGEPRLTMNTYELEEGAVGCDWFELREMTAGRLQDIPTSQLEAALGLVRGLPFKGVSVRYYGWAEPLQQEMITRIVETAYELATRQLVSEEWQACERTCAVALDVEPGDEQLWRMRITAAYARKNETAVKEATDRLFAQLEAFDASPEPETDEFLRQLQDGASVVDLMEMI